MILLHLPLHDLLLSRRICAWFRHVHEGSEKIKVALFLKPYRNYNIKMMNLDYNIYIDGRTVLVKEWFLWPDLKMLPGKPVFNPFLTPFVYADDWNDKDDIYRRVRLKSDTFVNGRVPNNGEDISAEQEWLERFHEQPTSSWRRMLLTQPAVDDFHFWCSKHDNYFNSAGKFTADDWNGVKVGMVHELLYTHLKHCVGCPTRLGGANRWAWSADGDIDYVPPGWTGWEIFDEIKQRSRPFPAAPHSKHLSNRTKAS